MTDLDMAQRAVAAPGWRWMDGMVTVCGVRVIEGGAGGLIGWRPGATRDGGGWVDTADLSAFLPDLTDPATLGCLLALVRGALSDPGAWCESDTGDLSRWAVYQSHREIPHRVSYGSTEAEALVCALEAAGDVREEVTNG